MATMDQLQGEDVRQLVGVLTAGDCMTLAPALFGEVAGMERLVQWFSMRSEAPMPLQHGLLQDARALRIPVARFLAAVQEANVDESWPPTLVRRLEGLCAVSEEGGDDAEGRRNEEGGGGAGERAGAEAGEQEGAEPSDPRGGEASPSSSSSSPGNVEGAAAATRLHRRGGGPPGRGSVLPGGDVGSRAEEEEEEEEEEGWEGLELDLEEFQRFRGCLVLLVDTVTSREVRRTSLEALVALQQRLRVLAAAQARKKRAIASKQAVDAQEISHVEASSVEDVAIGDVTEDGAVGDVTAEEVAIGDVTEDGAASNVPAEEVAIGNVPVEAVAIDNVPVEGVAGGAIVKDGNAETDCSGGGAAAAAAGGSGRRGGGAEALEAKDVGCFWADGEAARQFRRVVSCEVDLPPLPSGDMADFPIPVPTPPSAAALDTGGDEGASAACGTEEGLGDGAAVAEAELSRLAAWKTLPQALFVQRASQACYLLSRQRLLEDAVAAAPPPDDATDGEGSSSAASTRTRDLADPAKDAALFAKDPQQVLEVFCFRCMLGDGSLISQQPI